MATGSTLCVLPPSILANICERLGEAGEIIRVASSSKSLWAAAAGPLQQVQLLVLRCPAADLEPQLLLSLQQRFPCIQQLHVADGSWGWTGCRSLQAWAGSLTDLQANDTSFPLVALLAHDQQLPQHNQQPPRAIPPARNATGPHAQLQEVGAGSAQVRPHHSSATATTCRQHARGQTPQQLRQQQQRQQDAGSLVPAELQGLLHLQLQRTVTTVIKCQKHGSAECQCLDDTVLAALLRQNSGLRTLNLAGNSYLPDRLLHAASLAASCSGLKTLDLSGCELVAPGRYLPRAFPLLKHLDLSNTATADADVRELAAGLPQLRSLALKGCRRVSVYGIDALAAAPALVNGFLTRLDLGGLTRPGTFAMACFTGAWVNAHIDRPHKLTISSSSGSSSSSDGDSLSGQACTGVQLHVGFGRTAGVNDLVLEPFVLQAFLDVLNREDEQQQGEVSDLMQQLQALTVGQSASMQYSWDDQLQQRAKAKQQVLQQVQQHAPQPPVRLCGLQLAGCNGVSSGVLLKLGACGALAGLTSLDLSDTEAFRHPIQPQPVQQQQQQGEVAAAGPSPGLTADHGTSRSSSSSSSSSSLVVMKSALPQLLQLAGQQMRVLLLDGCYIGDPAAAAIAALGLTQLRELSLVGCRALNSPGLRCLLASLPCLQQLSIGGSVSGWSEGAVLQGLPVLGGLTQLNFVRRPALRDIELAPLLAAASNLRGLSLVGCYMLTDKVFGLALGSRVQPLHLGKMHGEVTAAAGDASSSSSTPGDQQVGDVVAPVPPVPPLQQLTQLCITACDGFTGSNIARLQGLRHLRISFCASLSAPALEHVAVSCRQLRLLELPAKLSGQGLGFTAVRLDGPNWSGSTGGGGQGHNRGSHSSRGESEFCRSDRGRGSVSGGQAGSILRSSGAEDVGLVLPQQGGGQAYHLKRLKVNWI